jgi:uncharacterized membrane-anchored protein
MSAALRLFIVLLAQTAALVFMIAQRQVAISSPRVVTLKVIPVDPSDMYRGDYVALRYDISHLDVKSLAGDAAGTGPGDVIYVTLKRNGPSGSWTPVSLNRALPALNEGEIALKGKVTSSIGCTTAPKGSHPEPRPDVGCLAGTMPASLEISYGVETYFVPQGTGRAIEDERQKGGVSVDIAVDGKGNGAIKAMRRNGRTFYVERLF